MWIIKLHIAISILLCITMFTWRCITKEQRERNIKILRGVEKESVLKKLAGKIRMYLIMFCPVLNIFLLAMSIQITTYSEEELKRMRADREAKESKEDTT